MTASPIPPKARPRLGFLGLGWIGRHRLDAIASSGEAEITAIADTSAAATAQARAIAPGAGVARSFDELLARELDGVVIATPSGLHAAQATAALEHGLAVFCQKPLARTAAEAQRVVDAAREANRLLGVDLSYRHLCSVEAIRAAISRGELGEIYAVDLVFHNAYGPGQSWCRDHTLAGGGCVIDLGVHLIDLAMSMLDFPPIQAAHGRLYANGSPLRAADGIEDLCEATIELEGGITMRIACSWHAHIGQDALIRAAFVGTEGTAVFENAGGSFYDFTASVNHKACRTQIARDSEGWGGRAAIAWVNALGNGGQFDTAADRFVEVSAALDRIYGR